MIKKTGAQPQKFAIYARMSSGFVSLEDRPALRKLLEEAEADAPALRAPECPDFIAKLRAMVSANQPRRSPTRAPRSRAQKKD